jgi:lipopolysaccharide export system permease protein
MLLKMDRYIGRAFLGSYLICLTGVIGMYVVLDVFARFEDFVEASEPLRLIAQYYALNIPMTFLQVSHFFPVMAAMFTITRLEKNNEFTPIKASGISVYRALAPILLFSFMATVLSVANQEVLVPSLAEKITKVKREVRGTREVEQILLTDARDYSLFVRRYNAMEQRMHVVNFTGYYKGTRRIEVDYFAREGYWDDKLSPPKWRLMDVTMYRYDRETGEPLDENEDGIADYPARLPSLTIHTSLTPGDVENKELQNEFLPYPLLRHRAKRYPHMPQVKIQVHQRFTVPLSAMVLLLLGMPFVLCRESTGVFLGIGICLLVCGAFFVTSFVFQDLGNKRFVQPLLASWSPVVLYGSAGICLFFGTIRT